MELHELRAAGLAANEADRFAEAYRLLLPVAEAGDAEIQGILGSIMQVGLHRVERWEQLSDGTLLEVDEATHAADVQTAVGFLQAASNAGYGAATFNLAGMTVCGLGGESWSERKARAAQLYALAYAQGFTAFGWLMQGEGSGQPYLNILEQNTGVAES